MRDEAALRAAVLWDEDRMLEAAAIGEKLLKRPGCAWLIERWRWLARAAARPKGWDEALTKLAFGLLGVDTEGQIGTVLEAVAGRRGRRDAPRDAGRGDDRRA